MVVYRAQVVFVIQAAHHAAHAAPSTPHPATAAPTTHAAAAEATGRPCHRSSLGVTSCHRGCEFDGYSFLLRAKLQLVYLPIVAVHLYQLVVRAALNYLSVIEHQDQVGPPDC